MSDDVALLRSCGEALYGPEWQRALARRDRPLPGRDPPDAAVVDRLTRSVRVPGPEPASERSLPLGAIERLAAGAEESNVVRHWRSCCADRAPQ
jgi:hypothetical protein